MSNLRKYQQDALDAIIANIQDHVYVSLPTGSGKSHIIAHLCQWAMQWPNTRIMVVAHVKELLQQNREKIEALMPYADTSYFCAGLGEKRVAGITLASVQSVAKYVDKLPPIDLFIVDEAHRIPHSDVGQYRALFASQPDAKVIGLTATPYRMTGGYLHEGEDAIFDRGVYNCRTDELIKAGYLSDIVSKQGSHEAETGGLHVRKGEFVIAEMEEVFDTVGVNDAMVKDILTRASDRRSIMVFCCTVQHCNNVAQELRKAGESSVDVVTGMTGRHDRADAIERFKTGATRILVNCDVLTTGFDSPGVDCIVMLRATRSPGLYCQIIGRGLRKADGKENCLDKNTLILTDKGLVRICDVTLDYKVWDGVSFVTHGGAVCKGVQTVISYQGLTATPDHEVMTNESWKTIQEAANRRLRIIDSGNGRKPIRFCENNIKKNRRKMVLVKSSCTVPTMRSQVYDNTEQYQKATKNKMLSIMQPKKTSSCSTLHIQKGSVTKKQMHKPKQLALALLRRKRNKVCIQGRKRSSNLGFRKLRRATRSFLSFRQNKQRRSLRKRKLEVGYSSRKYEQPEKTDNKKKIYSIQKRSSRNKICRCNSFAPSKSNDRGRNNKKIQHTIIKTKREVWDILNAGPLQRFTANNKLVHNCLLLDYGGNVRRHGTIDNLAIDHSDGEKKDPEPKACPMCGLYVSIGTMTCPECGFVWTRDERKINLKVRADEANPVWTEIEEYDVKEITYRKHQKPDKPPSLRVDYRISIYEKIPEWICIEHCGYAMDRAQAWFARRGMIMPKTVDAALLVCDKLIKPKKIRTKKEGKFRKVIGYEF